MDIREFLEEQYEIRKTRNSRYTLRAFSRLLETDSGSVIKVMKGKRKPGVKTIEKWLLCLKVDLAPQSFVIERKAHFKNIDEDFFEKHYKWIHPIFLESLRIKNTAERKKMVCKSLQISSEEHDQILDFLMMQGLVKLDRKNSFMPQSFTTFEMGTTTESRKSIQKKYLAMAIECIDRIEYAKRCNSTLSVGLSVLDIPKAKEILREARMKIGNLSKSPSGPVNSVYNVSTAFYPVIHEE